MGGPLSVTLSDVWMVKIGDNIVIPHEPIFYKMYVHDIINRRKKHEEDLLFKKLNIYHPKIKLKIQINPPKFLAAEIIILNNEFVTFVHREESKFHVPWESKVPNCYKRNILLGELHRVRKISSNFQKEVKNIKKIFSKANFPLRFINSVVAQFNNDMYKIKKEMRKMKLLFHLSNLKFKRKFYFCKYHSVKKMKKISKFFNF